MVKTNNVIIGFIIVSVILVAMFGLPFTLTGKGFIVETISVPVDIISNDPALNQKFLNVVIQFRGNNDKILAGINSADISSKTGGKYSTGNSFLIEAVSTPQTAIYPIRLPSGSNRVWEYEIVERTNPSRFQTAGSCPANTVLEMKPFAPRINTRSRFCIISKAVGAVGTLESPDDERDILIDVTVGSETQRVILNKQNSDVPLPNNRGIARLLGSSVTGDAPPNGNNFRPVFYRPRGQWSIVRATTASTYDQTQRNLEQIILPAARANAGIASRFFNDFGYREMGRSCSTVRFPGQFTPISSSNYNSLMNDCFREIKSPIDAPFITITQQQVQISRGQSINKPDIEGDRTSSVRIELRRQISNARVLLELNAAWIKVIRNVGKPKILDASCDLVKSGKNLQFARATVKNDGNAESTFCIRIENCDPFKQLDSCDTIATTIGAGQQASLKAEIDTDVDAKAKQQCTIVAFDRNNPSRTDSTTVQCEKQLPEICTPGEQERVRNCVRQCDVRGQDLPEIFCCKDAVAEIIPDSDPIRYQCPKGGDKLPPPQDCSKKLGFLPNFEEGCDNLGERIVFIIGIVVGLIVLIASFVGLRKIFPNLNGGLSFLFAFLIAGGVASVILFAF